MPVSDDTNQLHLQVEADEAPPLEAVSPFAVFGARRHTMLGLGLAGLMLMAVSARAVLPSHAQSLSGSTTPSAHIPDLAFSPSMPLDTPSRFTGVHKLAGRPSSLRTPTSLRAAKPGKDEGFLSSVVAKSGSSEREEWPEGQRPYRFIDRSGEEVNANFKTPDRYSGSRSQGEFAHSHRITFTMPEEEGKDLQMKTVELLRSNLKDNPTFGAVAVRLPLMIEPRAADCSGKFFSAQNRVVVSNIFPGNGKSADLRKGDIIRGVSMPDGADSNKANAWWDVLGVASSKVENGMAMFDNEGVAAYDGALRANERVHGKNAEVVLLIERQSIENKRGGGDDDDWFSGGPGIWAGLPGQQQMTPSGAAGAPGSGGGMGGLPW